MGALLPGALLGVAVGVILGRIWERWGHASRGLVTATKNYTAAEKALGIAQKLRRSVRVLLVVAIIATFVFLFATGYMATLKS